MCRLYKSVGEYDVVNAVLSEYVTTHPVTLQAVDAELHADYTLAAKCYNQVTASISDFNPLTPTVAIWVQL